VNKDEDEHKNVSFKIKLSPPPRSNKLFVANTAVTTSGLIKNSVMSTIQDSLTCQQFSMITSSLLQSLRIACSFTVFPRRSPQLPTVPIQRMPQCNVIDYSVVRIRKLCSYYWCDKTNFYEF